MEAVKLISFGSRSQDAERRYAMAQRLAVDWETPRRSAQTRQVSPERRQRRIRWPSVTIASTEEEQTTEPQKRVSVDRIIRHGPRREPILPLQIWPASCSPVRLTLP